MKKTLYPTHSHNLTQGPKVKYPCSLTRRDGRKERFWLPLTITVLLCLGLGINAFHSRFAVIVIPGLSFLIFFYPLPALTFIAASQYLPDYGMNPVLTVAQFIFIGYLVNVAFRKYERKAIFLPSKHIMQYWVPFTFWITICAVVYRDFSFLAQVIKGLLFAVIAYDLFIRSGCSQKKAVIALAMGFACAAVFYWAHYFDLTLAFSRQNLLEMYGETSRGIARIHAGRADANTSGASVGAALVAFLILIIHAFTERRKRNLIQLFFYLLVVLVILVPALSGSMSRGAILQPFIVVTIMLVYIQIVNRGKLDRKIFQFILLMIIFLFALILFSQTSVFDEVMFRLNSLYEFNVGQGGGMGNRGRTFVDAGKLMMDNPFFGMSGQEQLFRLGRVSHNTYLDAGLYGGIPGFVLFFSAIIAPLVRCLKAKRKQLIEPTLIGLYLAWLIIAFSLSVIGHKAIWTTWMLLMVVSFIANGEIYKKQKSM